MTKSLRFAFSTKLKKKSRQAVFMDEWILRKGVFVRQSNQDWIVLLEGDHLRIVIGWVGNNCTRLCLFYCSIACIESFTLSASHMDYCLIDLSYPLWYHQNSAVHRKNMQSFGDSAESKPITFIWMKRDVIYFIVLHNVTPFAQLIDI